MFYVKPTLKNISQGARLEYARKYRHMSADDVTEYFGFGGKNPIDVIYFHMWLEAEFPYYEIKFDCDIHEDIEYNEIVLNAIREWQ